MFSKLVNYILFFVLILLGLTAWTQENQSIPVYLSAREKAAFALTLRTLVQNPISLPHELKQLIETYRVTQYYPPTVIKVSSFEEFLEHETRRQFFSESNLKNISPQELLKLLERVNYLSDSPSVTRKIGRYYQEQLNHRIGVTGKMLQFGVGYLLTQQRVSIDAIESFLKDNINEQIQKFSSELNENNSKNVMLLSKLLKLYFKSLPSQQKAEILFKLLDLPLQAKPIDIFQVMIQNSGPQMQKLVQIVGRHKDIPEGFKEVFQKLESQVQKVPWPEVEALLRSEGVKLEEFSYFEHKPIGVGTMAQTHRAQYNDESGKRVSSVFRFLKPGIEQLLEMDHQILIDISQTIDSDPELKAFKVPSLKRIVEDLHNSVVEELAIEKTVLNQQRGREVYNSVERVSYSGIRQIIEFYVPNTRLRGKNLKLMEQELVFGSKVSKETAAYFDLYPDMYPAVAEKIAEHWLEQVLFGSGFFHADLHQGNLMMKFTDPAIKVSILDFGMVGRLTPQQRESAMLLALGVKFNYPEVIAKHFNLLSKQKLEGEPYEIFLRAVSGRSSAISSGRQVEKSLDSWVLWSLEQGLDLQYDFLKLNRGMTAIDTLLMDSKSKINLQNVAETIALRNKTQLAKILLRENLFKFRDFAALVKMGAQAFLGTEPRLRSATVLRCEALFN